MSMGSRMVMLVRKGEGRLETPPRTSTDQGLHQTLFFVIFDGAFMEGGGITISHHALRR